MSSKVLCGDLHSTRASNLTLQRCPVILITVLQSIGLPIWQCYLLVYRCNKYSQKGGLEANTTEKRPPTQLGPKHDGWPTTNCKGQTASLLPTAQHGLMTSFTRTGTGRSEQEPHRGLLPPALALAVARHWRLFPTVGRDGYPRGRQHAAMERRYHRPCTSVRLSARPSADERRSCWRWLGQPESPYAKGTFKVKIEFPDEFPFKAPSVRRERPAVW